MRKISYIILVALFMLQIHAQSDLDSYEQFLNDAGLNENWVARKNFESTIFAPRYNVLSVQPSLERQLGYDNPVRFEVRTSAENFYLLFTNEQDGEFPIWGMGSWIIKRSNRDGSFVQAKIFLQNDDRCYLYLYPESEYKTVMDIYMYGKILYKDVPIPVSFESLLTSPLSRLLYLTEDSVEWDTLFTNVEYIEWGRISDLSNDIRSYLGSLRYGNDGALAADNQYVYIETGEIMAEEDEGVNCSGFLKWVADGLYSYKQGPGNYLDCEVLKEWSEPDLFENNSWSSNRPDRDPYFGLDWTRNIAIELKKSYTGLDDVSYNEIDVTDVPFFLYQDNIGYQMENLETLFYLLAVKYPGSIYWGAINELFVPEDGGEALLQFPHVLVFIPYFDENGLFQCDVFDAYQTSAREIDISILESGAANSSGISDGSASSKYSGSALHLTRTTLLHPGFRPPQP